MGCATSIVKYMLFLFNLAFVLVGIAFIAVGTVFLIGIQHLIEKVEPLQYFSSIPIVVIVVGSIIFIVAFFGCCGAIKESTCMLTTYAVILIVILALQIALGVWAFLQIKDHAGLVTEARTALKKVLLHYDDGGNAKFFDFIQEELKCCGVEGPEDYKDIWSPYPNLPNSCCPKDVTENTCNVNLNNEYKEGCTDFFVDFITKYIRIAGIVVISIGAVELVGAIIALCLSSSVRNNERRGYY